MVRGGIVPSSRMAAQRIAAAVTPMVISGQFARRNALTAMARTREGRANGASPWSEHTNEIINAEIMRHGLTRGYRYG
jgi:hypothetical protein